MSITFYLTLMSVCLLGAMTPGPSLMVVAKNSLTGGRLHGVVSAWAHALAIALYALVTVTGLSVLMQKLPILFQSITYIGGIYLAYLGVKSLSAKGGMAEQLSSGMQSSLCRSAREGFLVSLLNPKVLIFFIALFSQFIQTSQTTTEQAILVFIPLMMDGLWFSLIALLLTKPVVIRYLQDKALLIDRLSGSLLIILASKVLLAPLL
ncbi:LysE family translocator [Catenovulum adriaticum]|uniref:LysE family translocator n=1 Tax=Catenovulum adriaticum TaxID=2984846 RepID=A0ABY7AIA0_9ALTE|nr:LysE family translocator [Catenovulum sp. TS8]WAJ69189.1 LysE family translocator [Catenovulum sp. TS8]